MTATLEASPTAAAFVVVSLRVADIDPDPTQARDEGADDDLSASIAAVGVLNPIRVYEHPTIEGRYIIEDGERRYRGTVAAALESIPAIVVPPPESVGDKLLLQVTSNDGKRLKPMEEARTFKRIMEDKGWNIAQLSEHLGRSKSTVSDRVAIADAPAPFVSYFEEGHLTAAAAPVLRQLENLGERTLARVAESFAENWNVGDAINDGKPIPLRTVEQAIDTALNEELREISAVLEPEYKGKCVMVGKRKFAVDVAAYDALERKRQATASKSAPEKREPDVYQRKQLAEQKKAREKSELRRLQIRALSAKLPTSLGGSVNQADGWSMFLVKYLVREMTHDTQRSACKLLGLEPPKASAHQGYQFDKAILKYAEGLKAPARVQLALQLLLAHDMYVSPNYVGAADRINDAAKLAKFDLSKVKLVETSKTPVFSNSTTPAKKAAKKGGRRSPNAEFMRPFEVSEQLAAIVGKGPMVRTEVTKKVWGHIKREGLQNKQQRRLIDADDKLKLVFGGKKQVSMFEMTKLINKHLR